MSSLPAPALLVSGPGLLVSVLVAAVVVVVGDGVVVFSGITEANCYTKRTNRSQ